MTIIYDKINGNVISRWSGDLQHVQTLYGEQYLAVWDEIILTDDNAILNCPKSLLKVEIESKQLQVCGLNYTPNVIENPSVS